METIVQSLWQVSNEYCAYKRHAEEQLVVLQQECEVYKGELQLALTAGGQTDHTQLAAKEQQVGSYTLDWCVLEGRSSCSTLSDPDQQPQLLLPKPLSAPQTCCGAMVCALTAGVRVITGHLSLYAVFVQVRDLQQENEHLRLQLVEMEKAMQQAADYHFSQQVGREADVL